VVLQKKESMTTIEKIIQTKKGLETAVSFPPLGTLDAIAEHRVKEGQLDLLNWVLSVLNHQELKESFSKDKVLQLLIEERQRAVRIAREYRDRANIIAKEHHPSEYARQMDRVAEECQCIMNTLSGVNAIAAALGETLETVVKKELDKKLDTTQP
jgi:hypothetical protein